MSAYQVMAAAGWDEESAQAIVQEQGSVEVLTGTLLSLVAQVTPVVLLVAMLLPFTWGRPLPMEPRLSRSARSSIGIMAAAIAVFALPIYILVTTAGLLVLMLLTAHFARRSAHKHQSSLPRAAGRASSGQTEFIENIGVLVLMGFLLFLIDRDPWLPREQVVFGNGDSVVGYVINSGSDVTTYIDADSTVVHRIPSPDIDNRSICVWKSRIPKWDRRLIDLEGNDENYPYCPDARESSHPSVIGTWVPHAEGLPKLPGKPTADRVFVTFARNGSLTAFDGCRTQTGRYEYIGGRFSLLQSPGPSKCAGFEVPWVNLLAGTGRVTDASSKLEFVEQDGTVGAVLTRKVERPK